MIILPNRTGPWECSRLPPHSAGPA